MAVTSAFMKKPLFPSFSLPWLILLAWCLGISLPLHGAEMKEGALLQRLIDEAARRGGGVAPVPAGSYRITETLRIPDGVKLRGESLGSVRLVAPANCPFPVLLFEGVRDAGASCLQIVEEGYHYRAKGAAVSIEGACDSITIRQVATHGFRSGFCVGRLEQGKSKVIVFENCLAQGSASFGFELNEVKNAWLDQCYSFGHRLDGIKLRSQTKDVTIIGGESSANGLVNLSLNGNGIDAYAGGSAMTVRDLLNERNNGSGIYLKTGPLQHQGAGKVDNAQIFNVRSRENLGSGVDINRSGGDLLREGETLLPPLISHFMVLGGLSERNRSSGFYVRARNGAIIAPWAIDNQRHGADLSTAWDVTVIAPLIVMEPNATGERYGIQVGVDPVKATARRVMILDGRVQSHAGQEHRRLTFSPAPLLAPFHIGEAGQGVVIDHLAALLPGRSPSPIAESAEAKTKINYGWWGDGAEAGGEGSTFLTGGQISRREQRSDRLIWQAISD